MSYNSELVTFHRYTKLTGDHIKGFSYVAKDIKPIDIDVYNKNFANNVFGFNVRICNYTNEAVILCASYGYKPTVIERTRAFINNIAQNDVTIEIITNVPRDDGPAFMQLITIKVNESTLRNGAVYVAELDAYLAFTSSHKAVRNQIRDDVFNANHRNSLIVEMSDVVAAPDVIYSEYKEQIESFVNRQNKIRLYTGCKTKAKGIIISIQDNYFVPSAFDKMIFNPYLEEDEFAISLNRYDDEKNSIKFKFSDLEHKKYIVLDPNITTTMMGEYHEMVVFSNKESLVGYFHSVRSHLRFDLENSRLPKPAVDITLKHSLIESKEKVDELTTQMKLTADELTETVKRNKKLKDEVSFLKSQIDEIQKGGIIEHAAEVVIENVRINKAKVDNERIDLDQRPKTKKIEARVSMFKHIADMLKSVNGILVAGLAVVTACIGIYLRYFKPLQPI